MNSNEAVTSLVEAFDRAGIPYMIVGSFSSMPTAWFDRPRMPTSWCNAHFLMSRAS